VTGELDSGLFDGVPAEPTEGAIPLPEAAPFSLPPAGALDAIAAEPGALEGQRELEGSQPLISAEESDAIIRAMRAGSIAPAALSPAPSVSPTGPGEAKPYQLGAPGAPLRRAVDRADRAAQELAEAVIASLLEQVGVIADAEVLGTEVSPVEETFAPYLVTATAWEAMPKGEAAPWATVVLGGSLADVVLARRLGADGAVAKPVLRKGGVGPLGRKVLLPIAEACLSAVGRVMIERPPALALVAAGAAETPPAPSAPCLRIGARVSLGDVEGDVLVVLHEPALAPRAEGQGDSRMRLALTDVDVELCASLGVARISVRDLLSLGLGSVLRLSGSPERPVLVSASGTPVLSGMPIVHEGNLAIEVIT
jgi:flagellar motor switch protein FliM